MRKRFLTATLIALVAVVGVLLSSPGVGARPILDQAQAPAGSPNNPKADIQQGNLFCGADHPELPVIGFTNYHRTGNVVSINYHLKGAVPNATYQVQLWGDFCSMFGVVETVMTNGNGVANASGSVTVPPTSTRFFATSFGPNIFNDTPAVTLLP
jgi:hypothetical protein